MTEKSDSLSSQEFELILNEIVDNEKNKKMTSEEEQLIIKNTEEQQRIKILQDSLLEGTNRVLDLEQTLIDLEEKLKVKDIELNIIRFEKLQQNEAKLREMDLLNNRMSEKLLANTQLFDEFKVIQTQILQLINFNKELNEKLLYADNSARLQVGSMNSVMEELLKDNKDKTRDLNNFINIVENLKAQIKDKENAINLLASKLDIEVGKIIYIQNENKNLQDTINNMKNAFESERIEIENRIKLQVNLLKDTILEKEDMVKNLSNKISSQMNEMNRLCSNIDFLQQKLSLSEKNNEELSTKIESNRILMFSRTIAPQLSQDNSSPKTLDLNKEKIKNLF